MSIQLLPTPVEMETPLGFGWCRFTWEWPHTIFWGVVQADTNEIWWWQNHLVRFTANISEGRPNVTEIQLSPALEKAPKTSSTSQTIPGGRPQGPKHASSSTMKTLLD